MNVMKKFVFLEFLIFWTMISPESYAQITVAIGDFQNQTDHLYLDTWEKRIPEFFQSELSGAEDIVLVGRKSLKAILDERALNMTGLVDTSTAQEVGRILSAQYVVTGSINQIGDWIRIDAKVINVASGKIFSEKVQSKHEKHLDKMIDLLGNNLHYQLTGKGQYQKKISPYGLQTKILLWTTLGSATATLITHFGYQNKREAYQNATILKDFDAYYNTANRLYKIRNSLMGFSAVTLSTTIFFWIQNISSEQILAMDSQILPYFVCNQKGEWAIGLKVPF